MSFRCQICNEAQTAGTRPAQIVTKVEPRTYRDRLGESIGWCIKEVKLACESCATVTKDAADAKRIEMRPDLEEAGPLTSTIAESIGA